MFELGANDIESLEWDSKFFDKKVGLLQLNNNRRIEDYHNYFLLKEFDLVYIMCKGPIDFAPPLFSDCKTEFKYDVIDPQPEYDSSIVPYSADMNYDDLLSLALQSGEYSRFKLDPNFIDNEYALLYKKWLDNSINGTIANQVLIAVDDINRKIIGLITLSAKRCYCEIGLLAVDSFSQGKGVGKNLVAAAKRYAFENGRNEIRVATQERNSRALNFYSSCGFNIFNQTYIYHYWPNK